MWLRPLKWKVIDAIKCVISNALVRESSFVKLVTGQYVADWVGCSILIPCGFMYQLFMDLSTFEDCSQQKVDSLFSKMIE